MNNVDEALGIVADLLTIMATLTAALEGASFAIKRARAEGRDLTDGELDAMREARLAARQAAVSA